VADRECVVGRLDDDPACAAAADPLEHAEPRRGVGVDVAGHEAGDQVLLRRPKLERGAVELVGHAAGDSNVERGAVRHIWISR
jgi:hypothetical protein